MHPFSEKLFEKHKNQILSDSARMFGVEVENLKKLGSFESFVYEFMKNGRGQILKITHDKHRSKNAILGELEWVNHLAENNITVAHPIPLENGEMVGSITVEDTDFFTYCFEKVNGTHPDLSQDNTALFDKWGRITGEMHAATKKYTPSIPAVKRHGWEGEISKDVEKHIPASQPGVIEKCKQLQSKMATFPIEHDSFGLIHSDLHHGNFYVDGDIIRIFDFDDCHYDWFVYDIAIPLFYVLRDINVGDDNLDYAERFLEHFLKGYIEKNSLDSSWLAMIPDFLKLREIELYIILWVEQAFDLNDWCGRFFEGRQERIEKDIPVIDMDFTRFC